jgi:hypothetical protein
MRVARRNRQTSEHRSSPPPAAAVRPLPPEQPAPTANPPRPSKLFLAVAAVLLLLWMSFLGILAFLVRS